MSPESRSVSVDVASRDTDGVLISVAVEGLENSTVVMTEDIVAWAEHKIALLLSSINVQI